jgi:hypothetical protein
MKRLFAVFLMVTLLICTFAAPASAKNVSNENAEIEIIIHDEVSEETKEKIERYFANGAPVEVTDNTFKMPASDVTVTATFKAKAVEDPWDDIAVKNDYVSGVTLVTVTGDSAKGYTYDGNAMYKVADGKFAYLVVGNADTGKVAEAASAGYVDLSGAMANDVNGTNKVDFNDAGAAFGCYNKAYDVVAYMAMYLRADVNGVFFTVYDENFEELRDMYIQ